jgi:putative zinc finger protein
MNCHDARERLSDWLDEALSVQERAEVGDHLDGCPDCRRELDRLRATLQLLSRLEQPRAPAGFVDRVMAKAHPVPWYHRLGRRLFLPLGTKLPVEAAAMLVIALLGVYLLQRTPELRDAGRPELQAPASRAAQAPTPAPRQETTKSERADSGRLSEPAPRARSEAEKAVGHARRLDSAQPAPPGTQDFKQEPKKGADADRLQKLRALTSPAAPAPRAEPPSAPAPAAPPAESQAKSRDAAEEQSEEQPKALAQRAPTLAAKPQSAMSGALGRLNVKDRPAAENELANLLTKVEGRETSRRREPGATVIEVLVPEARYADFARGIATLGTFTLEGQPTALPTDPAQLRLSIRISE